MEGNASNRRDAWMRAAAEASATDAVAAADAALAKSEARTPTFEDVRLMIREEIRAALAGNVVMADRSNGHNILADCPANERNFSPRPERLMDIERRAYTRAPFADWKV